MHCGLCGFFYPHRVPAVRSTWGPYAQGALRRRWDRIYLDCIRMLVPWLCRGMSHWLVALFAEGIAIPCIEAVCLLSSRHGCPCSCLFGPTHAVQGELLTLVTRLVTQGVLLCVIDISWLSLGKNSFVMMQGAWQLIVDTSGMLVPGGLTLPHNQQHISNRYLGSSVTFEVAKASGPCGSIRLVKLVSRNQLSPHKRRSGYEIGRKLMKNIRIGQIWG